MIIAAILSAACSVYEAQFSGSIKEIVRIENDPYACHIVLELDPSRPGHRFLPHKICPLDIEDVTHKRIYSTQCDFKRNDAISGIVVKTSERLELD